MPAVDNIIYIVVNENRPLCLGCGEEYIAAHPHEPTDTANGNDYSGECCSSCHDFLDVGT